MGKIHREMEVEKGTEPHVLSDPHLSPIKPEIHPYTLFEPTDDQLIWRYDGGDDRYYYRFKGDKRLAYLSVTSFTHKALGTEDGLLEWAMKMGKAAATHYMNMRAAYGTLLHIVILEIIQTGGGDFTELSRRAFREACDLGYAYTAETWASDLVNDVASFLKFLQDRNVKIIFAEFPVYSDEYGLAGCIDLGVEMDFGRKTVNALVDIKSGRKGFFNGHRLQLHGYKTLWNDLYGKHWEATHVFNFAPSDWRPKENKEPNEWPTYKLENQTDAVYKNTIRNRMSLAIAEDWINPPSNHLDFDGAFTLESYDLGNHVSRIEFDKPDVF